MKGKLAFCNAPETKDSAAKMLGDETLRGIARELLERLPAEWAA